MKPHFILFRSKKNRQWYFRLVAGNGKTVAQSEGYKRKANAVKGIYAVSWALETGAATRIIEK